MTMVGLAGRWSLLVTVVCWGRFSTSNKAEDLCPQPVVPPDAILAPLLSEVKLMCAGCEGRVSWSRRSPHGTPRPLNGTEGGHLVLKSMTYEDEDNYTCYKDGAPVCSVELMVKDERQDDATLTCYHRYPTHNITCEWRPARPLHPSSSVTLIRARFSEESRFFPCSYSARNKTFTCAAHYNEGDSTVHVFYLCVRGRTDSALAGRLEAYVRDLLQISAPRNVQVTPVENHPRKLQVSWSPPEFWDNPFYGLRYQVLYQVENSQHSSNGTTEETTFVIDDAVMGRKHLVRVQAREEFQENWGAWSEGAAGTPWSEGAAATPVPRKYPPPTPQEEEEEVTPPVEIPRMPWRMFWVAPCVSLGLVILFLSGLLIRYQEIRIVKLQWGFLRSLFHPPSKVSTTQPPARESLLMSPSSVTVTVPPLLEEE